jgi:hypothetical protein
VASSLPFALLAIATGFALKPLPGSHYYTTMAFHPSKEEKLIKFSYNISLF